MGSVRVLVVDDHQIVREGIRWMLQPEDRVLIMAEAGDGDGTLEAIERERPDVVLLDLNLPDRSGLEVLREIRRRFFDLPVVILTMSDEPDVVDEALRAGANGYLVKNAPKADLVRALSAAAAGDAFVQAEITGPLLSRLASGEPAAEPAGPEEPHLTPREREVLPLLAEGLTNRAIGTRLGISELTVKGNVRDLLRKLDAADRTQAVAVAFRRRLID